MCWSFTTLIVQTSFGFCVLWGCSLGQQMKASESISEGSRIKLISPGPRRRNTEDAGAKLQWRGRAICLERRSLDGPVSRLIHQTERWLKYTLCSSPHASFLCPSLCLIFVSTCNTADPVISFQPLLFTLFHRTSSQLSPLKKHANIKVLLCKSEVCMLCCLSLLYYTFWSLQLTIWGQGLHHHYHFPRISLFSLKKLGRHTQKLKDLHYNRQKKRFDLKKLWQKYITVKAQ